MPSCLKIVPPVYELDLSREVDEETIRLTIERVPQCEHVVVS